VTVLQPKAHAQDARLARRQGVEHFLNLLPQQAGIGALDGRGCALVLHKLPQLGILLIIVDGRFEREGQPGDPLHPFHLVGGHTQCLAQFLVGGNAPQRLLQLVGLAVKQADAVHHVNGHADGAPLVGDCPGDGLPDPPGGIGGKAETALVLVFFHRFHQAQVALLDQVQEGDAAPDVTLGNADHQAGVGFNEVLARQLTILHLVLQFHAAAGGNPPPSPFQQAAGFPAALNPLRQVHFLCHGKQRHA